MFRLHFSVSRLLGFGQSLRHQLLHRTVERLPADLFVADDPIMIDAADRWPSADVPCPRDGPPVAVSLAQVGR